MRRVMWRGVPLDERSAAMMDAVVSLIPDIPVTPTQGGWSGYGPSAGTHAGPGAVDIAAEDLTPQQRAELVAVMRRVGWAAWMRNPSQSDWPWHCHAIAVGCPNLPAAARDQVEDYLEGRNGLANEGPDDGPRDWVGCTFEEWENSEMPISDEDLDRIAWRVWSFNGGTFEGQSAASTLKDIPGRVVNFPLTAAGQHLWTYLVDIKDAVSRLAGGSQ